jgi:exopolyphosphatase/pppGpp-phosphohydrolase
LSTVRVANEPVAIELSLATSGAIDRRTWADAMRALGRLVTRAERTGANHGVVAVAPHALGSASNAEAFAAAVRRQFSIAVMLLSSSESVSLAYRASRTELADFRAAAAVIHAGDATIDVAAGVGSTCDVVETVPAGVLRLHEAYGPAARALAQSDAGALFALVRLCGGPACRRLREWAPSTVVFASENARAVWSIARLWGYAEPESASLDRVALHALVPEIVAASTSSIHDLGIDPTRVNLVGTTAVAIDALADLLSLREVRFTSVGVADGAALDVLTEVDCRPTGTESPRRHARFTAL